MKMKKFKALLMLALAVVSFSACSSDDNNDGNQTGTYKYGVFVSEFNGSSEQMKELTDEFDTTFGGTESTYTLNGTLTECNKKATELAIKAASKFADQEGFEAKIEVCNMNTEETLCSKNITAGNNGVVEKGAYWVATDKKSISLKNLSGKKVKVVSTLSTNTVYDGTVESDDKDIDVNRSTNGIFYKVTVQDAKAFSVILDK